jgi:3-(3-hydroxy-phenyl)propionate hydroxylase
MIPTKSRFRNSSAAPGETTGALLDPATIRNLLKPVRTVADGDILRAVVYTFEPQIAERWAQERVFLLGNAAHLTPPFAGQGMNAGLRDAHNLTWKIWAVTSGTAGPGLLESYEAERHGPAWAMVQMAMATAMGDIIIPRGERDIAFRTSLVSWMDRFPAARNFIVTMKFKPPPRYDIGASVNLDSQPFAGSLVGQMMPQPPVHTANGGAARLDDVIGPGFALIAQQEKTAAAMAALRDRLWPALQPTLVLICADPPPKNLPPILPKISILVPEPGPALAALRAHRDQIILVRPDRYVAAAF